mmetsp:Transcript_8572/g.25808  ORF Transcript_8572/g.25808 Transcript_8572/m.25808 type:complete len:251 (+) Transcript_8572:281-1033(+)
MTSCGESTIVGSPKPKYRAVSSTPSLSTMKSSVAPITSAGGKMLWNGAEPSFAASFEGSLLVKSAKSIVATVSRAKCPIYLARSSSLTPLSSIDPSSLITVVPPKKSSRHRSASVITFFMANPAVIFQESVRLRSKNLRVMGELPLGGTEHIAHTPLMLPQLTQLSRSRYFINAIPPKECPTSTGLAASPKLRPSPSPSSDEHAHWTNALKSSTCSSILTRLMPSPANVPPVPLRLIAAVGYPSEAKWGI